MIIREVESFDAEQLVNLMEQVDQTSQYMLWEAGERKIETENQLKMIKTFKDARNSTILVAEKENKLVGYVFAIGGSSNRNKHSAYIVTGILREYRGQGIGTKLFNELREWALKNNINRLELTVVTKNEAGLSLYQKVGFEIEGTKRNSLVIDGEFVDEYYMSKLL